MLNFSPIRAQRKTAESGLEVPATPTPFDDLKSAAALSLAYGIAAALAVPALLPSLPPEARELPLPLPMFCLVLGVQMTVLYGLLAWSGLRLARQRQLDPAPLLSAIWINSQPPRMTRPWVVAAIVGLTCGCLLVGVVAQIKWLAPDTLPSTLHPPSPLAALIASTAGSIGEEILCRLFLLSLLLRLLPQGSASTGVALSVGSLLFGALHAPAFVLLFGGLGSVPPLAWVWLILLNGIMGLVFGWMFLRSGIGAAIIAHFTTDLVWHVASQLAATG